MKKLTVFDLNGTLAESKSSIDGEMAGLLQGLLGVSRVAVISGGDWPQYEAQLLGPLPRGDELRRLSLLPTSGTKFYEYDGEWRLRYADQLTPVDVEQITRAMQDAVRKAGVVPEHTWGPQIEDRGSQVTYSALGQQAPLEAKSVWDPDFAKRQRIKAILNVTLPNYAVRLGGTTSIDVTKPGIDKAYGIRKLVEVLGIGTDEMIFVGDALFPGGNDYPAIEAGVAAIPISGPQETKRVIQTIIACLG